MLENLKTMKHVIIGWDKYCHLTVSRGSRRGLIKDKAHEVGRGISWRALVCSLGVSILLHR